VKKEVHKIPVVGKAFYMYTLSIQKHPLMQWNKLGSCFFVLVASWFFPLLS